MIDDVLKRLRNLRGGAGLDGKCAPADPSREPLDELEAFFDQAERRLSNLSVVARGTNSDYSHLVCMLDTLLVSLEQLTKLPMVEAIVSSFEADIQRMVFAVEELEGKRQRAVDEGEVNTAEQCVYEALERSEDMIRRVAVKWETLSDTIDKQQVIMNVVETNRSNMKKPFVQAREKLNSSRLRCQKDLGKIHALREKVEMVESQTVANIMREYKRSDGVLNENREKLQLCFNRMAEIEHEVEKLIRDTQREVTRRLSDKDRDEHRKAEFAQFCAVVDEHSSKMENHMKNLDALMHACDTLEATGDLGFESLQKRYLRRLKMLEVAQEEAFKQHTEVARAFFSRLGDIQYRKERMAEELEHNVQRAHVQQELHASTFNPNAKKFGDIKKKLLDARADLISDLEELQVRGQAVIDAFAPVERFLHSKKIPFTHPVLAQRERAVALRARAIESRAAALCLSESSTLGEIKKIQQDVLDAQAESEAINAETSGTVGRTIPLLRLLSPTKGAPPRVTEGTQQ
jgi:hypothetical protein